MRKFRYLLLFLAASIVWGCMKDIDETSIDSGSSSSSVVEVTEDGRYKVTAQLEGVSMTSVVTRATDSEDAIRDGWCLVFGQDYASFSTGSTDYTDKSPLIQIEPVTINANGTFTMVFDEYPNVAFMRLVVNMTDREDKSLTNIVSWRKVVYDDVTLEGTTTNELDAEAFNTPPTDVEVEKYSIATFGQYRYQSVGLDGIYNVTYNTEANIETVPTYEDLTDQETTWAVVYNTEGSSNSTDKYYLHGQPESYNENEPNPASPVTNGFPMSSYGYVMENISEGSLNEMFETKVYMIRTCSKVQVEVEDSNFTMEEVYVIDAAQESRIRSTVMSSVVTDDDGNSSTTLTSFNIPVDLGGTIDYLAQTSMGNTTDGNVISDPIYIYPNSGGDYDYNDGAVNQDVNPQYIIIKGQSSNYDTPGYYKVALKAKYPLDDSYSTYSDLTYDILRNTSFTIKLENIDKPGYKTYEDAADPNSPANNISYSITIETSDNRYEVLVSKGTYYTELETSRVYVKGYMDEGINGCYVDFTMYPSDGNTVPAVYVQSSDHDGNANDDDVAITHCLVMREGDNGYSSDSWDNSDNSSQRVELETNTTGDGLDGMLVHIATDDEDKAKLATKVRVYFDVNDSGRIRLRIGDILKFIPVVYDRTPISMYGTGGQDNDGSGLVVKGTYGTTWSDFSYSSDSDIIVEDVSDYSSSIDGSSGYNSDFTITKEGAVTYNNTGNYDVKPELRARILPTNAGDGNLVIYLRQASDFRLMNADLEIKDDSYGDQGYYVNFHSQSTVVDNETSDLFTTSSDGKSIVFSVANMETESVDALTLGIETVITTKDENGQDPGWAEYFDENFSDNGQTLTLSATTIPYDYEGLSLTSYPYNASGTISVTSSNHKYARQAYVAALKESTLVLYNNTATSTVSVTNSAGDVKTYTVKQTQYPPIYLIDASGQTTKTFSIYQLNTDDDTCVFALNIWNYDLNGGDLTSSHSNTSGSSSYQSSFENNVMKFMVGASYISSYSWPSFDYNYKGVNYTYSGGGNDTGSNTSVTKLNGTTTSTDIDEISNMGGYHDAEYIFGIVRDADNYNTALSVMSTLTVKVTDKYGYTYSTVKYLHASN